MIEVFYNADFPILMTARVGGGYPMVHAILNAQHAPPRLVVYFQVFRSTKNTQEEVKAVQDELLREVFDSYGQHNLFFELEDGLYKVMKGSPYQVMYDKKKTGMTMILVEE
jgi:hypothetical protein